MDIKFDKNSSSAEQQSECQRDKRRQSSLLVLLLLLLGVVGYLYFFTNLIRPMEPPPKPAAPARVVKKPLPARASDTVATEDEKKADKILDKTPAAEQSATAAPKPVADSKKEADAKAAVPVKKDQPAATRKTADKPLQASAKPVAQKPVPTPQTAQPAKAAATVTKPVAKAAPPAPANQKGPWLLVAGLYLFENKLAEDMARLKNAGFNPVVTAGPKRPITMYRLFFGSYLNREEAAQTVKSLQQLAGDGFMLAADGVFKVYAGSFAHQSGAISEQQNLAQSDVKTSVQKSEVMVASKKLTVGAFAERSAAESNLKKVRSVISGNPFLE